MLRQATLLAAMCLCSTGCLKGNSTPDPNRPELVADAPREPETPTADANGDADAQPEKSDKDVGPVAAPAPYPVLEGDPCQGITKLLSTNLSKLRGEPDPNSSRDFSTYRLPGLPGPALVYGRTSFAMKVYEGSDEGSAKERLEDARKVILSCDGWRRRSKTKDVELFAKRRTRGVVALEYTTTSIAGEEHAVELVVYPRGQPRQ